MVTATPLERQIWQSKPEAYYPHKDDKTWKSSASKSSEVQVSELLFDLIPCNSRLRYCVDVGTRNGEHFGDTPIVHSLLVANDGEDHDERQGPESFVDNDHRHGQHTWFGILLQPDDRAFQSLKRLHQPLGNLCLQISPSLEGGSTNDESLGHILKRQVSELPLDFDFLGLYEVGYGNYWLLRNFLGDSTYRPKVVCVSYDKNRPADVSFIPDRKNEHDLPSKKALVDLMSCYDYELATTTSRCCFFSTRELFEGFLRTGMRQPDGEMPTISKQFNTSDSYGGRQGQKLQQQKPYYTPNSPKFGAETHYSDGNGSKLLNNQQSLESRMTKMIRTREHSIETGVGSETLGSKWLSQRRKMFETTDSKPAVVSSNHETPLEWQTRTRFMPAEHESGMETKFIGAAKDAKREIMFGNEHMMPWNHEQSFPRDEFESRDDFVISSPTNTSPAVREGIESENFAARREAESRDIRDTVCSTNEMAMEYFPSNIKKIVPPDPIGDTISQKMKEKQKSPQDPPSPKAMNDSLLELKNEVFKLSQHSGNDDTGEIFEALSYETNESDDDFLPSSVPLDLTAICDATELNNRQERHECARSLMAELQSNGHAMICGTSISRFVCRDALYASHLLLCEADESARNSCRSKHGILRGYAPKCTERSSNSGLTDMVRKFYLGSKYANVRNSWPVGGMLDEETDEYIQASFQEYHDSIHQVAVSITKTLHEILASDATNSHIMEPMRSAFAGRDPNASLLTVFNCERGSRHDTGKPLITNDTDTSLVTILLVDGGDCANVQHELTDGKWESVRLPNVIPTDPVFMIYAGENLQKLSGDLIPSNSRRIVPSSGDQIVNGLIFSLMPSDDRVTSSVSKEPATLNLETLPNPISKLASELKDIDEMFQSFEFTEGEDLQYDSNMEKYFDEDFECMVDPFGHDIEDAREMRRSHIESQRLDSKNSRASYPFRGEDVELSSRSSRFSDRSPRRATFGGIEGRDDEELTRFSSRSSRRATFGGTVGPDDEKMTRFSSRSSRRASFGGIKGRGDGDLTVYSREERRRSSDNDRSSQLLGSPLLPIVIETKNDTDSKRIVKLDEGFQPMPLFATDKKVQQISGDRIKSTGKKVEENSGEKLDSRCLLPVASPWNPPSKEVSQPRNRTRKVVTANATAKASKFRQDSGKKEKPIRSRILYDANYKGRRYGEPKNQNQSLKKGHEVSKNSVRTEKKKNTVSRGEKKECVNMDDLLSSILEVTSVQSSEASAVLDQLLGDANDPPKVQKQTNRPPAQSKSKSKNSPNVAKRSLSSQNCDPIFKNCRESVSTQQAIYKTCKEVQSLPNPPSATESLNVLTRNNTLYNSKGSKKTFGASSDEYVPFRGSVVEWKMRENAKKIKKSSLKWEQRGYRFGCENGKKGK